MELKSLADTLVYFEEVFEKGRGGLSQDALSILQILVILEVIFAGIYMAFGGAEFRGLAKKILIIGFFFWIIRDYTGLLQKVLDGFLYAGARAAAGSTADINALRRPDEIFNTGLDLLTPAVNKVTQSTGVFGIPSIDGIILLFTIFVAVLCFGVIAIHVFITYLEYLLVTAAGLILLPFGIFRPTAFIAERVFGAIIAYGIKLMILALIVTVATGFLKTIALPETVGWKDSFHFLLISLALGVLSFHAPSAALALLFASPQLSAGAIRSAAGGAAVAGGTAVRSSAAAAGGGAAIGRTAIGAAGAMAGGWAAASASKDGGSGGEKSTGSKAMSALRKTAAAAAAPITGVASNVTERFVHGKEGAPTGRRQTMLANGMSPTQGGVVGSFRRGKFSIPQYRTALRGAKAKDAKPGGKES